MHGCVCAQTGFTLELRTCWNWLLLFWSVSEICASFCHPTVRLPSALAIAAVLGGDSRIYSGGDHHEGLHIGFQCSPSASPPHPRHPSAHRSIGQHLRGHRSKCEHLSKHPSCVARVVGALPRDELKSAVVKRTLYGSDAPPHRLTAGDTKRATLGIPGKLSSRIARLKQHSRQAVLDTRLPLLETRKPSRADAVDPDHQREEGHGAVGEERPTTPLKHETFNSNVLGRCSHRLIEASLSAGPWRINQILQIRSNAFALCGGCHLASHKTFDAKLLACYTQQYATDSGLRSPNLTELMSADRHLMGKIYQIVKEENWNLDDALHEYTSVRHDMVAVLQPSPRPKLCRSTDEREEKDSESGRHRHNAENPKEKATGKERRKRRRQKGKSEGKKPLDGELGQILTARQSPSVCATFYRSAPRKNALSFTAALSQNLMVRCAAPQTMKRSRALAVLAESLSWRQLPAPETATGVGGALAQAA